MKMDQRSIVIRILKEKKYSKSCLAREVSLDRMEISKLVNHNIQIKKHRFERIRSMFPEFFQDRLSLSEIIKSIGFIVFVAGCLIMLVRAAKAGDDKCDHHYFKGNVSEYRNCINL